jgi:hypothetical protein
MSAYIFSASGSLTLPLATCAVCWCRVCPLAGQQLREFAVVVIVIGIALAAATAAQTSDSR